MENVKDIIQKLRGQLHQLESKGEFAVEPFKVWHCKERFCGPDYLNVIRTESWLWGHCRSETCAHNSHDPLTQGVVLFIACKYVGEEDGERVYLTPHGTIFRYIFGHPVGESIHYRPRAEIYFKRSLG